MTTSRQAGFADAAETWNRRFEGDDFLFGTEPKAWLRRHAALWPQGGRILSVADGEGVDDRVPLTQKVAAR